MRAHQLNATANTLLISGKNSQVEYRIGEILFEHLNSRGGGTDPIDKFHTSSVSGLRLLPPVVV